MHLLEPLHSDSTRPPCSSVLHARVCHLFRSNVLFLSLFVRQM